MDTHSFTLSVNTHDIIKDLINVEDLFDFGNLNKHRELFNNKNNKAILYKNIWIDEFNCLRSEACSFNCDDDN